MAPMVAPQASLRLAFLAGGCGFALLCAPGARAHGIQSTLERLGSFTSSSPYQLESRFSSGVPARDAAVRMVSPDGVASVELGHTNAEGQLTFRLPAQARADWEVQVDAGPGHRDYVELPSSASATLHSDSALSHPALARSLRSLGVVALLGTMAGLLLHRPRR
jgi:nickel transport protein